MIKFMLVTFGFLGLAFYELSGGNEFDAEALRLSRVDPAAPQGLPKVKVAAATAQQATPAQAEPATVTRASFDLNALQAAPEPEITRAVLTSAATSDTETEQTLILPSLVTSGLVGQTKIEAVSQDSTPVIAADIRSVTGNRVNMRGGPGTDYNVVGKLTRGQEVEILSDPGTGWVKLRPVDGGSVGWMADFLLTNG